MMRHTSGRARTDPAVLTHHALGAAMTNASGARPSKPVTRRRDRAHTPGCRVLPHRPGITVVRSRPSRSRTAGAARGRVLPHRSPRQCDRRLPARNASSEADRRVRLGQRESSLDVGVRVVQREPQRGRTPCSGSDGGARWPSEHEGPTELAQLGHAFAMQSYLAVQTTDLEHAAILLARATQIAAVADDPSLVIRLRLIEGYLALLGGKDGEREAILSIVRSDPENFDEIIRAGAAT